MAENAGARFYEGLRVTADHLRHSQNRLWDAIGDLRTAMGDGRIAWGLRAEVDGAVVRLSPGVAFGPDGVRLAVDTEQELPLPDAVAPFVLRLVPVNEDRASLRLGGAETFVTLRADAVLLVAADAPDTTDALDIAVIEERAISGETTETGLVATQAPELFIAFGHHGHSGGFVQDAAGRWHYDGPEIEGIADLGDDIARMEDRLNELAATLAPLEGLPEQLEALADECVSREEFQGLSETVEALESLSSDVATLSEQVTDIESRLAALSSGDGLEELSERVDDLAAAVAALDDLGDVAPRIETLTEEIAALSRRVRALEQADPGGGDGGGGFDPDGPFIMETNWRHAQRLNSSEASELLFGVSLVLNASLGDESAKVAEQVVQVWFEPAPAQDTDVAVASILSLAGRTQVSAEELVWATTLSRDVLEKMLSGGGRVMLRVHCGALADIDGRVLSASLETFSGLKPPRIPGGILESWFFVERG